MYLDRPQPEATCGERLPEERHAPAEFFGILPHLLHDLCDLIILLEQAVHILHAGAGTRRDTAFALRVNDGRLFSLCFGHALDHGFDHHEFSLIHRIGVHIAHAGHHAEHRARSPHFFHLLELAEHVVHIEFIFPKPASGLFHRFLILSVLGLFDQGEHIAHTQDAPCHSLGVEDLQILQLFAHAGELDGFAGDRF